MTNGAEIIGRKRRSRAAASLLNAREEGLTCAADGRERSPVSEFFLCPPSLFCRRQIKIYLPTTYTFQSSRAHVERARERVRPVSTALPRQMIHARRRDAICRLSTGGLGCPCPPRRKSLLLWEFRSVDSHVSIFYCQLNH